MLHPGYRMDGSLTQPAPFWAALWLGVFFHICFELADPLGLATPPGPINMEHALLLLEDDQVVMTRSYHLFEMFRTPGGADVPGCTVDAPTCTRRQRPVLHAFASAAPGGRQVTLSVINLSLSQDTDTRVVFEGLEFESASSQTLACDDIHACNSAASPFASCLSRCRRFSGTGPSKCVSRGIRQRWCA